MERFLIDDLRPSDVEAIVAVVEETGVFRPCEVEVARDVIRAALEGEASGYHVRVARAGERVIGYACFGPTPCTQGTFDLYWIAVSPAWSRRGVAGALLERVEREVRAMGGRMLVAETSGTPPYQAARGFYQRHGFREQARIPDFYQPGDAKVVFVKTLWPG